MNEMNAVLPRVAMIGVGSMGGAILAGLRAPGVQIETPISVTTKSAKSAAAFDGADDLIAYAAEVQPDANRQAVRGARVVILGTKPWLIHEVLTDIAGDLEPGAIVVSIAAGVTIESMEQLVPAGVHVVRVMPNTPSYVGLGMSGICGGETATAEAIDTVCRIFETVGKVLVVSEDQIAAVGAVSGSGPAYVYLYVEQMTETAKRLGFSEADARMLVEQTVIGAAELLKTSGETPAQLRKNVTSPKGTTEQAILVLQDANLGEVYDRALAASIRRSHELAAEA